MTILQTPDYNDAVENFVQRGVQALMSAANPIYGSLRHARLPEGVAGVRVEVDDVAISSPTVHMQEMVEISREDVVSGNLNRFHEVLAQIANSHLQQFMVRFFEYVGDAAEAVGNSVDLDGQSLTWDHVLDWYQQVEWMPDDLGFVRPPQIVAGETADDRLRKLPEMTPAQQERAVLIVIGKQEEYVSRRRSRRLR